jgi:eukaryotic-like serine/threonine-protein kinase
MDDSLERHRRLRAVFDEAVLLEPSTRERFLDRACAGDPELRPEVMRLLAAHFDADTFLEQPATLPQLPMRPEDDFSDTERFVVLRRLGAGGMGVVYEVHDRVRDEVVALKTLRRVTAAEIYFLKQEFRSLADASHPNLVCLYELVVEAERCFFTMELVKGMNFVDYVRAESRRLLSLDRLRPALRQLVDGVSALHRMGKLHRDIKPSNVLVTAEGRVVILDFGLMTDLFTHAGIGDHIVGGTPAYASPEQQTGAPPSEASDWYGVGATLYEALTGRVPFTGTPVEVLLAKRFVELPAPSDVVSDVPADLSSLCVGLMHRDPSQRLSGREVLNSLGEGASSAATHNAPLVTPVESPFVGRHRELAILDEAFKQVEERRPAAVHVCGASGIGKSALIRAFLDRLITRDRVVVLSGRCYEHESVPYKALDGVVDSLSRFMMALPAAAAERLLPRDVAALPRLFPVLLRVPAIATACHEGVPPISEPFLLRRLAFDVLRELLVGIADRWRVVITIDDLQWADLDGALLLEELLRTPDAPPLLTLVAFRSEEVAGKPFLRKLLEDDRGAWSAIHLEPLPETEAGEFVGALFPSDSPLGESETLRITQEAGGSPFVLEQLARYAGVHRADQAGGPTFAEMFETRLGLLPSEARHFVETLAICGRPVAAELICEACGVVSERQSLVAMLRTSRFIRSSGSAERVETYHDRIREVLAAQMAPDAVRRIHGLMVQTLIARRSDDCEALFEHYRGTGDPENAALQAGAAAAKAATALAFDRAASFYRHALVLAPTSTAVHDWKEGLAAALANAGRPGEAAEAFLGAATDAGHAHGIELQRRAAEQFLIAGDIDRGLDLIRALLGGLGMAVPRSPSTALVWLLWRRARLWWRGLQFVPTPVEAIDADALLRMDTCWAAATGLALVDIIGASEFSVRHLLMALDAGEPSRVARALAMESAARGAYPTGRRLSARLVEESKTLARSVGNPHAIAFSLLADGAIATSIGQWKKASTLSEQALAILRDKCVGVTWELNLAQNLVVWSLMYQGELREVSRLVPVLLAKARSSGNMYIATELCTRGNYAWLAADQPDEGEREAVESINRWSRKGYHRTHYSAMLARIQTALYRGDAEAAWGLLTELDVILRKTCLTHVQVMRIESLYLRGRSALAMAAKNGRSPRFLSVARASASGIARERMPWSDPIALLLEGTIAYLEGATSLALRQFHDAADRFDGADMSFYAAVTRRRIGVLQDDTRGRQALRQADEWMAAQHIKNPNCMTRMLSPGFPDTTQAITPDIRLM